MSIRVEDFAQASSSDLAAILPLSPPTGSVAPALATFSVPSDQGRDAAAQALVSVSEPPASPAALVAAEGKARAPKRVRTDADKRHKCQHCNSTFAWPSELARHVRTHTGEKPFKCDQCSFACADPSYLAVHKRRHQGEPYKCDVCSYATADASNLTRHKRVHSGVKPYKCDVCDAAFKQPAHLNSHKRIHTGEKPFKCDRCDAAFAQAGHLARHKRTHLKRDGGNEETSGLHKRARNVLVGLGRRVYECDQCDEAFLNPAALATHMRVHDTVREHTCDLCGKAFLESSALAIHKKWTHGVEAQA